MRWLRWLRWTLIGIAALAAVAFVAAWWALHRSLPRIDRRLRQKIAQPHRVSFALTKSN